MRRVVRLPDEQNDRAPDERRRRRAFSAGRWKLWRCSRGDLGNHDAVTLQSRIAKPRNRSIVGIWQNFPLPMISRYLGQMGWDWVILDMQHGCPNTETAYECMHALRTAGATPMLRTSVGAP